MEDIIRFVGLAFRGPPGGRRQTAGLVLYRVKVPKDNTHHSWQY